MHEFSGSLLLDHVDLDRVTVVRMRQQWVWLGGVWRGVRVGDQRRVVVATMSMMRIGRRRRWWELADRRREQGHRLLVGLVKLLGVEGRGKGRVWVRVGRRRMGSSVGNGMLLVGSRMVRDRMMGGMVRGRMMGRIVRALRCRMRMGRMRSLVMRRMSPRGCVPPRGVLPPVKVRELLEADLVSLGGRGVGELLVGVVAVEGSIRVVWEVAGAADPEVDGIRRPVLHRHGVRRRSQPEEEEGEKQHCVCCCNVLNL